MLVGLCERAGAIGVLGHAMNLELRLREGIDQAAADERNGEMGDVDADPTAVQLLPGVNGRAAAAEGIEHHIAFVRGGRDDAFEESERF